MLKDVVRKGNGNARGFEGSLASPLQVSIQDQALTEHAVKVADEVSEE